MLLQQRQHQQDVQEGEWLWEGLILEGAVHPMGQQGVQRRDMHPMGQQGVPKWEGMCLEGVIRPMGQQGVGKWEAMCLEGAMHPLGLQGGQMWEAMCLEGAMHPLGLQGGQMWEAMCLGGGGGYAVHGQPKGPAYHTMMAGDDGGAGCDFSGFVVGM